MLIRQGEETKYQAQLEIEKAGIQIEEPMREEEEMIVQCKQREDGKHVGNKDGEDGRQENRQIGIVRRGAIDRLI